MYYSKFIFYFGFTCSVREQRVDLFNFASSNFIIISLKSAVVAYKNYVLMLR